MIRVRTKVILGFVLVLTLVLGMAVLASSGSRLNTASGTVPSPEPCDTAFTAPMDSLQKNKEYRACRYDRIKSKLPPLVGAAGHAPSPDPCELSFTAPMDSLQKLKDYRACRMDRLITKIPTSSVAPAGVPGTWALAFDDEFNGTSLDASRWAATTGIVHGVTNTTSNVSVSGGNLVLNLSDATHGAYVSSAPYDGAGNNGYLLPVGGVAEARVYFPSSDSEDIANWPAFWAVGHGWPSDGEQDVAEGEGGHLGINYVGSSNSARYTPPAGNWGNAFHTYAVYRKATTADVYWDGHLVRTYNTGDNGNGEGLVLNLGLGVNQTPVTGTAGQVKVDYVRAWRPVSPVSTTLTNHPAQPAAIVYDTPGDLSAYAHPGALVVAGRTNYQDQAFKDVSAAGGSVLIYLDTIINNATGRYHDMLINQSACGPPTALWPGNPVANTYGSLSDFRVGSVLQSKLHCVLEAMVAENPHMAGWFADDIGSRSWYPGFNWDTWGSTNQAAYRAGAIALTQTFRDVANEHGLMFLVNGTWGAGTVAAAGGGYPDLMQHGNALADGGFVEHHDGEIAYWAPYGCSAQWAAQSPITQGHAFNYAVTTGSAGQTEFANSNCFAYVANQSDYGVTPTPWSSFHATGLPSAVAP